MKVSELKKLLKAHGCRIHREGTRHEIWISPQTGKKFQVPRHNTQDIPMGTLKSIKKDAGID